MIECFKGKRLLFLCGIFSLGVVAEVLAATNGETSEHFSVFAIISGVVAVASFLFGWLVNQTRSDRLYLKVSSCERIREDCKDRQEIRNESADREIKALQAMILETKGDIKSLQKCNQLTHEAVIALIAKFEANNKK